MDEADRERFLATLRADEDFRASVRKELLTVEVLQLPSTVAALVDAVAQQRQDFRDLAQSMANYMRQMTAGLQQGFAAIGAASAELRSDVGDLRSDVRDLRAEVDRGFSAVRAKFDQIDADLRDLGDRLPE